MSVSYGRQAAILDPALAASTHVTVLGLGTVGSNAAVELARLGIGSLHVVDLDVVEEVNLPSQAYHLGDVGRPKAEALADRIAEVSDHVTVRAEQLELYGGESFEAGPVVLAVDDMEIRKAMMELSLADRPSHALVIDGRMAGKMWQLLAFDPCSSAQVSRWVDQFYFPQDQAVSLPCGGRTVSFIGAFTGGMIASYICRHLSDGELPFFAQGDLEHYSTLTVPFDSTPAAAGN